MEYSAGEQYQHIGKRIPLLDIDASLLPHNFKHYQNCSRVTFDLPDWPQHTFPSYPLTKNQLGSMLYSIYGVIRMHATIHPLSKLLRPVASGGAIFPAELYLLVNERQALPPGAYHYNPISHTLDILSHTNVIHQARDQMTPCNDETHYMIVLSCMMWKNGHKYRELSYRLQSLDLGVAGYQCQCIAHEYQFDATIHYQFVDEVFNSFIGLNSAYEHTYTVIDLKARGAVREQFPSSVAHLSFDTIPTATSGPAVPISRWPSIAAVHHSSSMLNREAFQQKGSMPPLQLHQKLLETHLLPDPLPLSISQQHLKRRSQQGFFSARPLTTTQLATILHTCTDSYANDIDDGELQHTLLYCIVQHVENIPAGIYLYQRNIHALRSLASCEDFRTELQTMFAHYTYLTATRLAAVYLFPVGSYTAGFPFYGNRWYRMQNMEAGLLLQRAYLSASALRLGCRASLAYDVTQIDHLLHLPAHATALALLSIGYERKPDGYYDLPLYV